MSATGTVIFRIQNRYLRSVIFTNNAFETAGYWCIVGLTAILRLYTKEQLPFSNLISNLLIGSFYYCLVKER